MNNVENYVNNFGIFIDFFEYLLYNIRCVKKERGYQNMNNSFKDMYKVEKSSVEVSNEIQMALRENEEYDRITDNQCEEILNFFSRCYPGVSVEIPKKRKKTLKSINAKSKNKEIERLSKLYVIEGISSKEIKELYILIEQRIYENQELDTNTLLKNIMDLLIEDIEKINVDKFLETTIVDGISNSTKKALLRILRGKIEKSNLKEKEQQIELLEEKYGKKAEEKSGNPEDNIIQYESIEEIRQYPEKIELLHDDIEYLKSEDLMGIKIIIANIPSNIEVEDEFLKELISLRDSANTEQERRKYDNMAMQEIARGFINRLATDKEFLETISAEAIPFSLKHKNKTNGYEAYHMKIRSTKNPQYTLEIQSKSEYVENLARGYGEAAHENRPGKKRILPSTENEEEFIKNIKYIVPEYTLFRQENGKYKARKCSMLENTMGYFENLLYPGIEVYDRVISILQHKINEDKEK